MATSLPDDDLPPIIDVESSQAPESPQGGINHIRPGLKAPIPDVVDEAEIHRIELEDMTVGEIMAAADHVKRVVRNYRNDPTWPPIRRRLCEAEIVLADRVERGVHTVLDKYRLGEVRKMMGKRS